MSIPGPFTKSITPYTDWIDLQLTTRPESIYTSRVWCEIARDINTKEAALGYSGSELTSFHKIGQSPGNNALTSVSFSSTENCLTVLKTLMTGMRQALSDCIHANENFPGSFFAHPTEHKAWQWTDRDTIKDLLPASGLFDLAEDYLEVVQAFRQTLEAMSDLEAGAFFEARIFPERKFPDGFASIYTGTDTDDVFDASSGYASDIKYDDLSGEAIPGILLLPYEEHVFHGFDRDSYDLHQPFGSDLTTESNYPLMFVHWSGGGMEYDGAFPGGSPFRGNHLNHPIPGCIRLNYPDVLSGIPDFEDLYEYLWLRDAVYTPGWYFKKKALHKKRWIALYQVYNPVWGWNEDIQQPLTGASSVVPAETANPQFQITASLSDADNTEITEEINTGSITWNSDFEAAGYIEASAKAQITMEVNTGPIEAAERTTASTDSTEIYDNRADANLDAALLLEIDESYIPAYADHSGRVFLQ